MSQQAGFANEQFNGRRNARLLAALSGRMKETAKPKAHFDSSDTMESRVCRELECEAIRVSMDPSDAHHDAAVAYVTLGQVLTETEVRVLQTAVESPTVRVVAEKLEVSIQTVKGHLSHARRKIGVATTIQAAAWAFRHGLIV